MSTATAAAIALLAAIATGGCAYLILAITAAIRFRRTTVPPTTDLPPISVLKPLAGLDQSLEENLRSFFKLDYPQFELLFAVRDETDPAIRIVRKLQGEFPAADSRLIVTGPPPSEAVYPNAKVWSLIAMERVSNHPILVISDSDIHPEPHQLRAIAAEVAATVGANTSIDWTVRETARANLRHHLGYIGHLADRRRWLAGDEMSFADLAAAAHLSAVDYLGEVPWDRYPAAKTWYMRLKSRRSFRPLLADRVAGFAPPPHYDDLDF